VSRLEVPLAELIAFLDDAGIIMRRHSALDLEYLGPLVDQITAALERPEITAFYQGCLKTAALTDG
jgi:hypothetical protein